MLHSVTAPEIRRMALHHDQMQGGVRGHLDTLIDAVRHGGDWRTPHRELCEFISDHILPHIDAENDSVLTAGTSIDHLAPLVDGLRLEHAGLLGLADEVADSQSGIDAVASAASFLALLEVHVETENDVLLPGLVKAGADPESLLHALRAAATTPRAGHDLASSHRAPA